MISASLYFLFLAAQCLCPCVFDHIIHSQLVNWQSAIFNHWLFQIASIIVIIITLVRFNQFCKKKSK